MSVLCGNADHKTITKWVWPLMSALADLEIHLVSNYRRDDGALDSDNLTNILISQIVWENRFKGDKGNDCLVSCDGTDFKTPEHGPSISSHKIAKKSGLRCEVCICILTGDVAWINGPFACGKHPDMTIFRTSLLSFLGEFERVEADNGHIGEAPRHVKCPKCFASAGETLLMQQRARN